MVVFLHLAFCLLLIGAEEDSLEYVLIAGGAFVLGILAIFAMV